MILYFTYAVLLMIRTEMIVRNYGSEINAVFQTGNQIFAYFCLIESGMGMAYQFRLYEPIQNRNINRIMALFAGLKKSMKKVAIKMFIALIGIAIIFPFLMNRISLSAKAAGWMIFLLGFRLVIPYFNCMASKAFLNVYDYRYLVDVLDSVVYIAIALTELLLIMLYHPSIYIILSVGCICNIVLGLIYMILVWHLCEDVKGKSVSADLEPEKMTHDIFLMQISGLMNSNIDVIILSIQNIMLVTPYQAYNSIMSYMFKVINKIDENYRTKIGLKIERGDSDLHAYFQKFMSYHMILAIIFISLFTLNINDLIFLWLGKEFQLSTTCVLLMVFYLIHAMTRDILYLVRDGAGLYKESKWMAFREGMANLILSVVLVRYWGIEGVLFATVFATYTMFIPKNSKLVYQVLKEKNTLWMDYILIGIISALLVAFFHMVMDGHKNISWMRLVANVFFEGIVCSAVSLLTVFLCKKKYLMNHGKG